MQQAFQQVLAQLIWGTTWYKQRVKGVVIPNLYRQCTLNPKADLSSSNSKKGHFLLCETIYTSSIYIIHVLQSTFGFSDWSGVIRVTLGSKRSAPFQYRTFLAMKVQIHQKHHLLHFQKTYHTLCYKAVNNDKIDLLNAFEYCNFPTEAYLKYQWVTL